MRQVCVAGLALMLGAAAQQPAAAQRRGAEAGPVSFAVVVTDSSGAQLTGVDVDLSGAAAREGHTEDGRIAFENLPAGTYQFKFQKNAYITLERDVVARGRVPIDVKVVLDAAPPPPAPPASAAVPSVPKLAINAKPLALDLPSFIEKNYVGKAPQKTTALTCSTGGPATLLQLNDTVAEQTYADADEFVYVVAGQGTAVVGTAQQPLDAGAFLMIPRGTKHSFAPGPKKPLVMLSVLAGAKCGGA
ncbi:MAG: cupin domain-containing protein [Vicinamibacterales bacterium]